MLTVIVTEAGPPLESWTDFAENVQVLNCAGSLQPAAEFTVESKFTVPLNPPIEVSVMVAVVEFPANTEAGLKAEAAIPKSCTAIGTVIECANLGVAELSVAVIVAV